MTIDIELKSSDIKTIVAIGGMVVISVVGYLTGQNGTAAAIVLTALATYVGIKKDK